MTSFKDAVKNSREGILLQLQVIPGSSQTMFPAGYNSWRKRIEIKVQAQAKDNKANNEVRDTIASFFQLSIKEITIVSGLKNREKTVALHHIQLNDIYHKLEGTLHGL
jgi:uncharacterized protein (TIGR00251 family)